MYTQIHIDICIWFALFGFGSQFFGSYLAVESGIVGFGALDSATDVVLRETRRKQRERRRSGTGRGNGIVSGSRADRGLCNARACAKSRGAFLPSNAGGHIGFIVARLVAVLGTGLRLRN